MPPVRSELGAGRRPGGGGWCTVPPRHPDRPAGTHGHRYITSRNWCLRDQAARIIGDQSGRRQGATAGRDPCV